MSAAPHPPGRSPPDWYPCIPPPRPVSLPPGPRGSRSVVLAAARLRALHLDPLRHPTATGQLPRKTTSALDNGPRLHREVFPTGTRVLHWAMAGGVRDPPYQEPLPAFSQTGLPDDASPGRRRPRHHRLAAPASAAFTGHRSSESETRTHHGSDQTLHSALSAGLDGLLRRLHRLAPATSEGGPGQPGGGHVTARPEPPTAVPGVSRPV